MKSLVLSPFNIWLSAAIELIPRDELMALIRQFNSEAEYPTVKLLNTLITEYGHEFADRSVNSPSSTRKQMNQWIKC